MQCINTTKQLQGREVILDRNKFSYLLVKKLKLIGTNLQFINISILFTEEVIKIEVYINLFF